jgi:hypothetical protein
MVRPCLVSIADQESSAETEKLRRHELRVTHEREALLHPDTVPRCEDEDVRDPQGSSRYQKVFRRLPMRWKSLQEKAQRPNHVQGHDRSQQVP